MWAAIFGFLLASVVPIAIQLMIGFGVGIVSYVGADFAISSAESYIFSVLSSTPSNMYSIIRLAGFTEGMKIVFAGYSAYIGIKVSMGGFTKLRFN